MFGSQRWPLLLATFLSLFSLWRQAYAASGSIDLYLQNNSLDDDAERSFNNIAYYGVYYIGTPARRFLGCFDTGSSDTWVPSNTCTSTVCRSHDQYDPNLSSSEQNTSDPSVIIRYGTGTVEAILVNETVGLAGINITNQGIAVATRLTFDFSETSCDGLVGLGFQQLASTGAIPPFLNAVREGVLDENLFSIWLSPDPGYEPAGQISFGKTNQQQYSGALTYVDVFRLAYWQVRLTNVLVDGEDASISAASAIIDSGTTAIVMATSDANRVNSLIPTAVYWEDQLAWNVSCDISQLPDVTFTMGGQAFSVPARLYVQSLTNTDGTSVGACASAIVGGGSSTSTGSVVVLGTNFLRAWYTSYSVDQDARTAQIGFAPGLSQNSSAQTGRRLAQDSGPLFSRPARSLPQPKWGENGEGRRRLLEEEQGESQPAGVFPRPAHSVKQHRWSRKDSAAIGV